MPLYMLDTNTVSAALRGTTGLDKRLQQLDPAQWCISAITRAELRYGVALKPEATKLARYVRAYEGPQQALLAKYLTVMAPGGR